MSLMVILVISKTPKIIFIPLLTVIPQSPSHSNTFLAAVSNGTMGSIKNSQMSKQPTVPGLQVPCTLEVFRKRQVMLKCAACSIGRLAESGTIS
jgi:hypothetical protein